MVKPSFTALVKPWPCVPLLCPLPPPSICVHFADSVLQGVVMSSLMQALHQSALVFSIYSAQSVPTFNEVLAQNSNL